VTKANRAKEPDGARVSLAKIAPEWTRIGCTGFAHEAEPHHHGHGGRLNR
jgi:hypothetical protein